MQQKPVMHEARQLKRLNAATRQQSHMYKWIAFVAAMDAVLVFCYDRDMRNITFSGAVALVCGYLWIAIATRRAATGGNTIVNTASTVDFSPAWLPALLRCPRFA